MEMSALGCRNFLCVILRIGGWVCAYHGRIRIPTEFGGKPSLVSLDLSFISASAADYPITKSYIIHTYNPSPDFNPFPRCSGEALKLAKI